MHDITEHLHFDFSSHLSYNTIGIVIPPISSLYKKNLPDFNAKRFSGRAGHLYIHIKCFSDIPLLKRDIFYFSACQTNGHLFLSSDTLTDFTGFSSFEVKRLFPSPFFHN